AAVGGVASRGVGRAGSRRSGLVRRVAQAASDGQRPGGAHAALARILLRELLRYRGMAFQRSTPRRRFRGDPGGRALPEKAGVVREAVCNRMPGHIIVSGSEDYAKRPSTCTGRTDG